MNLIDKTQKIKMVILDVDGVLTDGRIGYGGGSEEELKFFNVKDGSGIRMLKRAGFTVGFVTGRSSPANRKRAAELNLDFCRESCTRKLPVFQELLEEFSFAAEECLYLGDDFIDWPVMKRVGVSVAVADAAEEVRKAADLRCKSPGGHGAVREMAEWLLKTQNKWQDVLDYYDFEN